MVLPSGKTGRTHGGHHQSSAVARKRGAGRQACWTDDLVRPTFPGPLNHCSRFSGIVRPRGTVYPQRFMLVQRASRYRFIVRQPSDPDQRPHDGWPCDLGDWVTCCAAREIDSSSSAARYGGDSPRRKPAPSAAERLFGIHSIPELRALVRVESGQRSLQNRSCIADHRPSLQ